MLTRRRLALLLLAALAAPGRAQEPGRLPPQALVEAMRAGGVVVYLRHAITDERERDSGRLGEEAEQRDLNAAGRAQARRLGESFAALDIPLGRILASPVRRARDTAWLGFGEDRVEVTMDIVADDYAGGRLREMLSALRHHLATPPPPGETTLLIGHRTPLEMAPGARFPDSVLPGGRAGRLPPGGGGRAPARDDDGGGTGGGGGGRVSGSPASTGSRRRALRAPLKRHGRVEPGRPIERARDLRSARWPGRAGP